MTPYEVEPYLYDKVDEGFRRAKKPAGTAIIIGSINAGFFALF